jgi:glycosyltransferase involved in cell wall biosynthesis
MRVVHISSMDFGGAGKAAYRLHKGLQAIGVDSQMAVMCKQTRDGSVGELSSEPAGHPDRWWDRLTSAWNASLARYPDRPPESEIFSTFTCVHPPASLEDLLRSADIVNLHWVAGVFDESVMAPLLKGKPVVWTLHDMNPLTGGCHYAGDCTRYRERCGACPQLASDGDTDLSRDGWLRKSRAYDGVDLTVVTPSRWLNACSSRSALLGRFPHHAIPYGFPLDTFRPMDRRKVRAGLHFSPEQSVLLFCADSVFSRRKGFRCLLESLELLSASGRIGNPVLAVIGGGDSSRIRACGFPVRFFGSIGDESQLALLYNAADLFVLPSLEDNLPNTVVESLGCGTPVAAFSIGGVPDMVDHGRTGWLAPARDARGLSEAIEWCIRRAPEDIRTLCRLKAESHFSLELQARRYLSLYRSLCAQRTAPSRRPLNKKTPATMAIVTPSFNQRAYLEECIDSVLSQNYPHLEYVIMDGGSTDGSVDIIKKYEKHLTGWESRPDGGHYSAINEGFRRCSGDIMSWLNSDDKYHPGALWLVSDAFGSFPDIDWLMGSPTGWDEHGKVLYFSKTPPLWSREKYLRGEIGPPHIQQESTFWRRRLWEKAGGRLDTSFSLAADTDLWARFFRHAALHTLHAPLGGFRRQPDQKTARFLDLYNDEAKRIAARERRLYRLSGATALPPAPAPLTLQQVVSKAGSTITPSNFGFFTYSRTLHFPFFGANDRELYGAEVDPSFCDLKVYQDLLIYTFIRQNIPAGSRILEIGGGDSRILRRLQADYECWNLDKLEGLGNGPTHVGTGAFKLVRAYIGSFSPELPDGYFDFAFSISALEHVEETEDTYRKICDDIARVLKPGGWSLHCFDIVATKTGVWTNGLLPFIFKHIRTENRFAPLEQIYRDPFTYAMSEASYNRYWRGVTRVPYRDHGLPLSYNVLWANPDSGSRRHPVVRSIEAKEGGCRVSAIVSTYDSERYISACLENLVRQTLYRKGELEIVVINSGSSQGEDRLIRPYVTTHPHIVYRRTERETLYAAWNRAIQLSRGRYTVNTNTDDALREDALERLADALDAHPAAELAYGDCALTRVPNDRFEDSHAYRIADYPPYRPALGMLCCLLGPHPMWRRTVFEKIGLFNPSYHAAGDYDFQMRFIEAGCLAVHVPEVLSLFFQNTKGLTLASDRSRREAQHIERRYRARMPIERLYAVRPDDAASVAAAWVAQGNLALAWQCPWLDRAPPLFEYAAACYRAALKVDPAHRQAVHNLCTLIAMHGQWEQCRDLLSRHACQDDDLHRCVARKHVPIPVPVHAVSAVEPLVHSRECGPRREEGDSEGPPPPACAAPPAAKPLRVLYDISVLGLGTIHESARTGVFRVVEQVALGLASAAGIELAFCATQSQTERRPETIRGCRRYLAAHGELRRIPFSESALPDVDLFHSPFHSIPNHVNAPVRFLTVYDMIPLLFPQYLPASAPVLQKITLSLLRPGDRLLCISRATRNDVCRLTGIAPERIRVTYLAADRTIFQPCVDERRLSAVRRKYRIGPEPYLLSLCTLEPRKNIDHVIHTFGRMIQQGRAATTKLVLVGTDGWDYAGVYREIGRSPELRDRIVRAGYVADEDLSALYSGAVAFVYMSHYEGFGLPPLEAMQCGTPVIVSDNSSLPEVVGEAGILLDSRDADGLALAMNEVAVNIDLRAEMSRRAIRQAALFSWKRCVEETIDAYFAAVKRSRHAFSAENRSAA